MSNRVSGIPNPVVSPPASVSRCRASGSGNETTFSRAVVPPKLVVRSCASPGSRSARSWSRHPSAGEGRVVLSGGALGEGADADGLRGLGHDLARRGEGATQEVGGEPEAGDPPSDGGSARSTPPGGMSARRGADSPAETSSVPGAAP